MVSRGRSAGVPLTLAAVTAVVGVLTLGALTGLRAAVRDPLGTYRRAGGDPARVRLWAVVFIGAAVALFWLRSSNPFVGVAFTAVVILGWGLVSTGPWIVAGLGRLLAWRARRPATFLAGRRLSDSPRSAWRTVGGLTLACFIAGFVAISLPAGLGNVGTYASRAERPEAVVPAASLDAAVREAETVLRAEGIRADAETGGAPDWLKANEWATLTLDTRGPDTEQDRARTAMIKNGLWGPEMSRAEDLPNMWLLRDGVVIGFLVLPTAALVALASMIIGAIARIFDQRDTFIALRLAGTPKRSWSRHNAAR